MGNVEGGKGGGITTARNRSVEKTINGNRVTNKNATFMKFNVGVESNAQQPKLLSFHNGR